MVDAQAEETMTTIYYESNVHSRKSERQDLALIYLKYYFKSMPYPTRQHRKKKDRSCDLPIQSATVLNLMALPLIQKNKTIMRCSQIEETWTGDSVLANYLLTIV